MWAHSVGVSCSGFAVCTVRVGSFVYYVCSAPLYIAYVLWEGLLVPFLIDEMWAVLFVVVFGWGISYGIINPAMV